MEGRMRPYLPELTIRDYNTYLWYLRGVRWQMYRSYGLYSCRLQQHNGVLFALLADSLAGRPATCKAQRLPGNLCRKQMMCQTQGIRLAAQVEVMLGWHKLQDRRWDELPLRGRLRRAVDRALLRGAYEKAVKENPALERLFGQEQEQAVVQMNLNANNYTVAAEPMSNIYGALYSTLATDDPGQRKSMRYIGSCIGRVFYLLEKAARVGGDKQARIELDVLEAYHEALLKGESARTVSFDTEDEKAAAKGMFLLTAKPVLYVCNVDDASASTGNAYTEAVAKAIEGEDAEMLIISAQTEADIAELESYEEKQMFLEDMGLAESGCNRLIKAIYHLLTLQTFITAGEMEVKAWTFRRGWKAPQCAGVIHTDFEKGFIRAEVIKYDDYIHYGSEAAVREAGKMGVEGKDYVVQDGDIMHFRFNV